MNFKRVVIAVIVGMTIVGLFQAQGQGPNYEDDPVPIQDRPYGNFNEYKYEYHPDDYEFPDGQNTP